MLQIYYNILSWFIRRIHRNIVNRLSFVLFEKFAFVMVFVSVYIVTKSFLVRRLVNRYVSFCFVISSFTQFRYSTVWTESER
jgi:hypothetical protein